jgi:hypothetical protein
MNVMRERLSLIWVLSHQKMRKEMFQMILKNLTPHAIVIRPEADASNEATLHETDLVIQPYESGGKKVIARVAQTTEPAFSASVFNVEIPIARTVFGEIENLPDPEDGVLYIVSLPTAQEAARRGRKDVVAPDTGDPRFCIRTEGGQIFATRRLLTFS